MSRLVFQVSQLVIDLVVLSIAWWAAFYLRFDGQLPLPVFKRALFLWPYVVGFQFLVLSFLGVTRFAWRYVGLREAIRVLGATGLSASVLLVVRLMLAQFADPAGSARYAWVPVGVALIDFLFAFLGITGVRILRRIAAERSGLRMKTAVEQVPTLLVGADSGGVIVAKEISAHPELGIKAVGFVDNDPAKIGTVVHGIAVLGRTDEIPRLKQKYGVEQVLVTSAFAPRAVTRKIVHDCENVGLKVKIIPGIEEIVEGRVNLTSIRDVAIEDLLGRDPVRLNMDEIQALLRSKVVLVTGAGGSIGSELCRQVLRFGPTKLVMVERYENGLFEIQSELQQGRNNNEVCAEIGDVTDRLRVLDIMQRHRPHVVFHAAAHKHVPMMERNPAESVKNNIGGTKVLAELSATHGVGHFVLISTDKAVQPTSVMGATKRIAERLIRASQRKWPNTKFVAVRFGNVLGSNGSVVPLFKQQIAKGGPVTVTHPDMKRYFMIIPEAVQLVMQAAALGKGGELFVLDMGEPVKIVDLARDLITLSGFEPDREIKIEVTGIRPGEKLFEELCAGDETTLPTRHSKIFMTRTISEEQEDLLQELEVFCSSVDSFDATKIRRELHGFVPEYASPEAASKSDETNVVPLRKESGSSSLPHR